MAENTWFSFFKGGVKLLEALWKGKGRQSKIPVSLFSKQPQNAFWGRHVALQKAKVARAQPGQGHGVPRQFSGHGAQVDWQGAIVKFLQIVFISLTSFFKEFSKQWAMVAQALQWLQQGARNWQCQQCYGILFRELQARRQQLQGTSAFSFQIERPHQVVAEARQQGGAAVDKRWGNGIPSSPSQTIKQALFQIQRGDQNGFGSIRGLHPGWCSKRNKSQSGQTFNPLVCDKKGGKFEANYGPQRGKLLPATKTFQVGELAGNVFLA
jgi:hypothetical protein